jgi:hypothetical protein
LARDVLRQKADKAMRPPESILVVSPDAITLEGEAGREVRGDVEARGARAPRVPPAPSASVPWAGGS